MMKFSIAIQTNAMAFWFGTRLSSPLTINKGPARSLSPSTTSRCESIAWVADGFPTDALKSLRPHRASEVTREGVCL
jgi:hypothetical protein